MPLTEPLATALLLATFGALLVVSVLSSRFTERVSVPVALVFLLLGIFAGSEGVGGIAFADYRFAFRLGTIALVLILFDGGFNTPMVAVRRTIRPAGVLATLGVAAVAGLVALGAHGWGFAWPEALVLGAIVSSTDAAAVFAVLRGSGLHLKRRVGATLEVESGVNDPMAVILTMVFTENLRQPGGAELWRIPLEVLVQLVVGLAAGLALGLGGRALLARLRLPAVGLYPAATLGIACIAFGLATLFDGSGFLAVYIAGLVLGNGPLPYRAGIVRVHDALAWLSQITMFLILGLLVFPSRLSTVAWAGLGLTLFLAFVARPLVVWFFLLPFGYKRHEVAYIGWVGLRGAVPIVLAIYPVLVGVPGATRIFDTVFFIVVLGALIPGSTVPWVTRHLGLERAEPPPPPALLAIESRHQLQGELTSHHVTATLAVCGVPLGEVPWPDGAAAVLVVRGRTLVPATPDVVLQPDDHVYVLADAADRPLIHLLFGQAEGE
ncbi:MAG TPA: potassium/proton antiporter [Gemmatimonadales bacterium]|nr:potassium/proton antiporter [Gemmatimonadales bacterium]